MDLQRLVEKFRMAKPVSNLPPAERKAVIELRSQPDTTITRSDKGGELVVMKTSTLHQICLDHLSDSTTYTRLENNATKSIRLQVNKTLEEILSNRGFPPSIINNLKTPSTARTQRFYALPKTHKKTLKIQPIVSACGGVLDRLGWLLQYILKPLLKTVPAHIRNTA